MLDPSNVVEVNNRQFHIVEHSALHLVFKKLILLDQSPGQFAADCTKYLLVVL